MKTVHKFLVLPGDGMKRTRPLEPLPIHPQAKIVHVGADPTTGGPAVWAEVITDWEAEPRGRVLAFFGTGWEVPAGWQHVGTAICGQFVWHVYERVGR